MSIPLRPPITVLCGSTRFMDQIHQVNAELTSAGHIVLAPAVVASTVDAAAKARLDRLHLRKIELADSVYVVDVDGYIGESTRAEIKHAERIGRPIEYFSANHAAATNLPAIPPAVIAAGETIVAAIKFQDAVLTQLNQERLVNLADLTSRENELLDAAWLVFARARRYWLGSPKEPVRDAEFAAPSDFRPGQLIDWQDDDLALHRGVVIAPPGSTGDVVVQLIGPPGRTKRVPAWSLRAAP